MNLRFIKIILSVFVLFSFISAHAVIQDCDKGVNFDNGNTYKKITGTVNCVLRKNPSIKTQSVSLRNGKKHGKSITYGGFYRRKDSAKNRIAMIENYKDGKKHGKFIIYDEKNPSKINVEKDYKNGLQQREMRLSVFNGGGGKTISYYAPKGKWSRQIGSLSYNKAGQLSGKTCPKVKSHVPELNRVCGFGGNGQAVTLRNDNGKATTTAVIKQGQTQKRKAFYASGNLAVYDNKGRLLREKLFFNDGKLMRVTVVNGDDSKMVKEYDKNGRLIKSASYYPDGSFKR